MGHIIRRNLVLNSVLRKQLSSRETKYKLSMEIDYLRVKCKHCCSVLSGH